MDTDQALKDLIPCWLFGTGFFILWWKLGFIKNWKNTIIYSVLYTLGGLLPSVLKLL